MNRKFTQTIYQDKRWWDLRERKKRNNPICEECAKKGRVSPVEEVHHIIPFETGSTPEAIKRLAFDYDNLESVCIECHQEIHKRINGRC